MNHQTTNRSLAVTALLLLLAALLWGALLAVLVLVVPDYERAFRARDLTLPAPTLWVLAAGRWAASYWYVVPLFGLLLLPFLLLLSWVARHRATGALPGRILFGALLGLPLLLQLAVWLALLL